MGLVPKFRKGGRRRTKLEKQNIRLKAEMTDYSGPFHFISTPPLWKRSIKIYPLRIKDQKCRHVPPHQKLPKFSFPLRKKAIFFQTPRKYLKDQRRRRSVPLRNDVQGPPQKISSIGGVWILNGMALVFLTSADSSTSEVFVDLWLSLDTSIGTFSIVSMK